MKILFATPQMNFPHVENIRFFGYVVGEGQRNDFEQKGGFIFVGCCKMRFSSYSSKHTHTSKARVRSLDSGMHNGVNLFLHSLKNKFVGFLLALSTDMCVASLLSLSLPMNTFFCNSKSCLPIHMQSLLVQWQVFDGQSIAPFFLWRFSWPKNNKS